MNGATWDWQLVGAVFGVLFLAQLPGKSALTALVLSTRHALLPVLAGAGLALAAHSAIAVAAGGLIALLPPRPIHIGAGLVFLVSAAIMWRGQPNRDEASKTSTRTRAMPAARTFGMTFVAIFLAEWGDLTQLATAALAARYRSPVVVFVGAVLGLWTATGIAIVAGRALGHLLKPELTPKIAAAVFAGLGAALVFGVL
jgi:putative Ca2+/H+ antiporter (TMEM165/GDT1 family)